MKCKICGVNEAHPNMSVSCIGPVCYTCYQKPQKQSHREEMVKKFGKHPKIDYKDHKIGEFE
jgi:predicted sugar kinase